MAEMTNAEALAVAQGLRNHYRAFEKIAEMLALVPGVEQALREKRTQLADLDHVIAERAAQAQSVTQLAEDAERTHQALQRQYQVDRDEWDQRLRTVREEHAALLKSQAREAAHALRTLREAHDAQVEANLNEIEAQELRKTALTETIESIQAQVAALTKG